MLVPILSTLTKAEAEDALLAAARRHPALTFEMRGEPSLASGEDADVYEVAVAADDFARFEDIIFERLIAELSPVRLRLKTAETKIAALLAQVLVPGSDSEHAVSEICTLLEWRHVPYLLDLGDFVDGFSPDSVRMLAHGVALAGRCFFFEPPYADRFEAELRLHDDGTLEFFDLRFGDLTKMVTTRLIPQGPLESREQVVASYRVLARQFRSDPADGKWAFEITKRW